MAENTQDGDLTYAESVERCEEFLSSVKDKSQQIFDVENPQWSELAEKYVAWYRDVETYIEVLLSRFDIHITSPYRRRGRHQHHENVLCCLSSTENPFYEVLGKGEVLEKLRNAKQSRNVLKGGQYVNDSPDMNKLRNDFNVIEKALDLVLWGFQLGSKQITEYEEMSKGKEMLLKSTVSRLYKDQDEINRSRAALIEDLRSHRESVRIQRDEQVRSQQCFAEERKQLQTKTRLKKTVDRFKDDLEKSEGVRKADAISHKKELTAKDQAHRDETARLIQHHTEEMQHLQTSLKVQNDKWVLLLAMYSKQGNKLRMGLAQARETHSVGALRQKKDTVTTSDMQQQDQQMHSAVEASLSHENGLEGKERQASNATEPDLTEQRSPEYRESYSEMQHDIKYHSDLALSDIPAGPGSQPMASADDSSTSPEPKEDCKSMYQQTMDNRLKEQDSFVDLRTLRPSEAPSEQYHQMGQLRRGHGEVESIAVGVGGVSSLRPGLQDYGSWTGWI